MKLVISARARHELDSAIEYLIERNPAAAVALRDEVFTRFERLLHRPYDGVPTTYPGLHRAVVVQLPYIIYYRVTDTAIEAVSIFAAARDPDDAPGDG